MEKPERAPVWKVVIASIMDFTTIFVVGGYVIGALTGGLTPDGFVLKGSPALLLFAAVILYFYVGHRYAGGTLWYRVFGIRRPRPD